MPLPNILWLIYLYAFILALCIGSFLNVVIYRLPLGKSVADGRSFCPHCKNKLKNRDLIPVFSFLLLKGRCRSCKQPISPRYCMVELTTALLALLVLAVNGANALSLCYFAIAALLLCVALIDADTMTIPDPLIIALALCILPTALLSPLPLWQRAVGFVVISLPMLLLCLVQGGAFGGGDIKLMAVCGALLGWQNILLAMFIGVVGGGIWGVYLLRSGKAKKGANICFGPFLSVGICTALLFGAQILASYFSLY